MSAIISYRLRASSRLLSQHYRYSLLLVLLLVAGGCDNSAADSTAINSRSVIDMAGVRHDVVLDVQRIGTLGSVPVLNTFVEALGAGDKIYNSPSAFHDIHNRWKMHKEFAPQIAEGPTFQSANHELLLENIMAAKPDLCLTMSRNMTEPLNKLGIPTLYIDWDTLEKMQASIRLLGEVLNRQDTAQAYLTYFDQQLKKAKTLSQHIPQEKRLRVLYGSPLNPRCPEALTELWIELAGGRSVTAANCCLPRQSYDVEDLLRWDPEVIFFIQASDLQQLRQDAKLRHLNAVRHNRLLVAPTVGHMWGGRTIEAPVATLWMLHKLYPGLLSREILAEEIAGFYQRFFNYSMSDKQVADIIDGTL